MSAPDDVRILASLQTKSELSIPLDCDDKQLKNAMCAVDLAMNNSDELDTDDVPLIDDPVVVTSKTSGTFGSPLTAEANKETSAGKNMTKAASSARLLELRRKYQQMREMRELISENSIKLKDMAEQSDSVLEYEFVRK